MEKVAYYIPVEEPIIIEITGKKFSDEERQIIEKVIKTYFGLKLGDKMMDLDDNRNKYIVLLLFSILSFITFYILFMDHVIETILEVASFGFWFVMWEFAELAFLRRNNLKTEKLYAGQLSSATVTFVE